MSGPDVIWANIGGLHGKQSGWCCTVKSTLRTKRDVAYLRKDGLPKEAIEALRAVLFKKAFAEQEAHEALARWDKLEAGNE